MPASVAIGIFFGFYPARKAVGTMNSAHPPRDSSPASPAMTTDFAQLEIALAARGISSLRKGIAATSGRAVWFR